MAVKKIKKQSKNRTSKLQSDAVGNGREMSLSAPDFLLLVAEIKSRIQSAQTRAIVLVNEELVRLYWDIGRIVDERQKRQGWGASVVPRLARQLHNELPELKGFSERNIGRMILFFRSYPTSGSILPQGAAKTKRGTILPHPAAKLDDSLIWKIPWFHHIVLLEKIKEQQNRFWYMQQIIEQGWSRNILLMHIEAGVHLRRGKAVSNFSKLLPHPQSDLAQQTLKDPYIFDFLTLSDCFHERELETSLIRHLEKFLIELGQGFSFVGRQYRIEVGKEDYYIDLLFYHLRLRCFVVIDLKKGKFKPEYAGKLNFYCNVVNDYLRHSTDQPTVGLILCQSQDRVLAEYSLSGIDKPIGVSTYQLTRSLPKQLQSALPTVEEIEAELTASSVSRKAHKPSRVRATRSDEKTSK